MAIQGRRGDYADFRHDKLVTGEWAVVISGDPNSESGRAVYLCFVPGIVERMATYEDMVENINLATEDVQAMFTADLLSAIQAATQATASANNAITNANNATANANSAADRAEVVYNRLKDIDVTELLEEMTEVKARVETVEDTAITLTTQIPFDDGSEG